MGSADRAPQWVPVSSSHLSEIMYDPEARTLGIRFQNGAEYTFENVEPDIARGLVSAPSPGRYFNRYIKGRYDYSQ
jgi:lysyl-tRNA synthetase class 2